MRWFNNLSVLPKFLVTSLLICAIMSAAGWVGLTSVQSVASLSEQSYQNNTLQLELLQDAKTKGLILGSLARTHIIATDQKLLTTYADALKTYQSDFTGILDKVESMKLSGEAKATVQRIRTSFAEYGKSLDQVVQLSSAGKKTEAYALLVGKDVSALSNAFFGDLQTLVDAGKEGTRVANQTSKNTASTTMFVVLAIVCGGILVSIVISFAAARSLAKPMAVTVNTASRLARGDLCRDMDEKVKASLRGRRDEVGKVAASFDSLTQYIQDMSDAATRIGDGDLSTTVTPRSDNDELGNALRGMVTRIGDSIGDVALGAEQVSASSDSFARSAEQAGEATSQIAGTIQQVAMGAGEQTRAVTDSAAMVSQMSAGIEHVAANSRLVATASTEAAEAARNGATTVDQSIQAMQRIRESIAPAADKVRELGVHSTEIGNIVEVIDDIAEQTNLLALNAAIEAARAGEHGKGFAVVADEVRKLAERSSKATKEIASLIATVQNGTNEAVKAMDLGAGEVDKGAKLAAEAGHSLEEILKATSRVNEQVLGISSAAQEMMESSTEVVKAIENISSISEENAAAAEEVSAATEEMTAQVEETTKSADELAKLANDLQSVVARFTLAQGRANGSVTPLRAVESREAPSGRSMRKSA